MSVRSATIRGTLRLRPEGSFSRVACLGLALLLAPAGGFGASKAKDKDRAARANLIRALGYEVAVTKVQLPRGKRGVFVSDEGKIDEAKAKEELQNHGLAVSPGMPVQITKIEFKSDRIVFEINGGGKKGKKWYQRIQVGVGSSTAPVVPDAPTAAHGSWVSLTFSGKAREITAEEAKKALSAVLDFERRSPTVLYSPSVPPEIKEAIKNHQVIVGMNRDAVLSSKGAPDRKVREVRDGVEQEDWIYGLPPHVLFVTFDGDVVIAVKQH